MAGIKSTTQAAVDRERLVRDARPPRRTQVHSLDEAARGLHRMGSIARMCALTIEERGNCEGRLQVEFGDIQLSITVLREQADGIHAWARTLEDAENPIGGKMPWMQCQALCALLDAESWRMYDGYGEADLDGLSEGLRTVHDLAHELLTELIAGKATMGESQAGATAALKILRKMEAATRASLSGAECPDAIDLQDEIVSSVCSDFGAMSGWQRGVLSGLVEYIFQSMWGENPAVLLGPGQWVPDASLSTSERDAWRAELRGEVAHG